MPETLASLESPEPSSEKGTIAMAFVHEALVCLRERSIPVEPLLRQAGIAPELLAAPQARVSSWHYGRLWHGIADALDDEFFGLDSRRMKAGSFTLLCHAVIHAGTLERALRRAMRFLGLVLDDLCGELQVDGAVARLIVRDVPAADGRVPAPKRAFAYGTFLVVLHGLACWLVGRRIPILRADFRCAEPPFLGEWQVLFAHDLHFDQPLSAIAVPAASLALPTLRDEHAMKDFLRGAPANFLVKYRHSTGLTAQIRRRLRAQPPSAWPDFAALARQFHLSEATLRRRLDDEGASYRTIRDDLRRDLAIGLLGDAGLSLADVAEALGFAETSAFHRAFRKWTGSRPGEYRPAGRQHAGSA